ncbi:MAG: PTS sugar transporter subunit IIA [Clostridium sp.]|uniref:PTS sugar transporter subunit IIA n=1 Tax=Clostridium sp. TaxID=1506 RepID=UPI003F2E4AE0
MFNSRQFQIIELLKSKNLSMERISRIIKKSSRTIMRDINFINDYLEKMEIGKIIFIKEKNGYEIENCDEEKLDELLKGWLNEEEQVLYKLLKEEYVTIEDLSEELYISMPVVSSKLGILKESYKNIIDIDVCKKGHFLNESNEKKIIILANLIYKKERYFIEEAKLDFSIYEKIQEYFNENKLQILEEYPYINAKQFFSVVLAIYILFNKGEEKVQDSIIGRVYTENNIPLTKEMLEAFSMYLKKINRDLKKVTRGTVLDILLEMEEKYEIKVYDMNLVRELVAHISRGISYSYILKVDEIYNLENIKALNPFSFDLSLIFSKEFEKEVGVKIYDRDLLALYFICSLERVKNTRQKVIIAGRQISLANINKNMIEGSISNLDIEIVSSTEELNKKMLDGNIVLLVDNNSNLDLSKVHIRVVKVNQIISSKEIKEIEKTIENIILKENIEDIFKEEYAFEYEVLNKSWDEIIEGVGEKLVKIGCLNEEEAHAIIEREKQDNLLIINGISIPHCMSKRKDLCVGALVKLSKEVLVQGEKIDRLIIVCVNPENKRNSNIFSYLYRIINNNRNIKINNYNDFILLMKEKN